MLRALAEATAIGQKNIQAKCGALGRLLAGGTIVSLKPLFPQKAKARPTNPIQDLCAAIEAEPDSDLKGLCVLSFASRRDAEKACKSLSADRDVRYAHLGEPKRTMCSIDPLRNRQWALRAIDLCQAQELPGFQFAHDVKIAVIDTGVDREHPDLIEADIEERMFTSGRIRDKDGHGTHIIGTIAAVTNNNIGIAGVCQSRRLMSLKALDPFSQTGYYQALRHAMDHEVQVLNLSVAGPGTPTEQTLIRKAIASGMIVVAAMGNERSKRRFYPAAYPDVIAVGASTQTDTLWRYSNQGKWIDLVAPGVNILSTVPHRRKGRRAKQKLYDAEGWDGTSMAAAFVTGAVALCLAKKPGAVLDDVHRALCEGADRIEGQTGFTKRLGWGRLNVARTLSLL
jgi:hypothetical protein